MAIFDESIVEAGHRELASFISSQVEVLIAATDLIHKIIIFEDRVRTNPEEHADYKAFWMLGSRILNDIGAATRLLDCGYFIQAAALLRDIAEVGMLGLYFSDKPEKLRDWRKENGKARYRLFGRSKLKTSGKFNSLDIFFDAFSEYGTHPSSTSIIAHHDGTQFHIFPYIDKTKYINTYSDLAYIVWHTTDACGDAYKALFGADPSSLFPIEVKRFSDAWNGINSSDN